MNYTSDEMSEEEVNKTTDVTQSEASEEKHPEEGESKSAKGALSKLNRLLSEAEMKKANPAAFKLILDKVDTLQTEVDELKKYREDYHTEKNRADVYEEKNKSLENSINSRSVFILFGGLILGFLPQLWSNTAVFITAILIGLALVVLGFINVIKK